MPNIETKHELSTTLLVLIMHVNFIYMQTKTIARILYIEIEFVPTSAYIDRSGRIIGES